MFKSILLNQSVLRKIQQMHGRSEVAWPPELYLTLDDFNLIRNVADVLQPIQDITFALPSSSACVVDLIPLMTSALDSVF